MASIIRMPSVLAGSEEAAIANWLVTEGQRVEVGDPLAEIETEKAIVEYNAEDAGIIGRVVLAAGESGEIGAPIAVLIAEGESGSDIDAVLGSGGAGGGSASGGSASGGDGDVDAASTAPASATAPPVTAPESATTDAPARDPEAATPVVEAESVAVAAEEASPDAPAGAAGSGSAAAGSAGADAGGSDSGAPARATGSPDTSAATGSAVDAAAGSATERESAASGGRLFVSPIARKLAREAGIDPQTITGSGPGGRIVRRDVEAAVAAPAPVSAPSAPASGEAATGGSDAGAVASAPAAAAPAPAAAPSGSAATAGRGASGEASAAWDLVPHSGMRKAIARRLTESKSTVPHFYLTTECVVDDLLALRAQVNAQSPVRVSVNDFVVKAVAAAFAAVPEANVTWSDEGMRVHRSVDIAVAVATEGGLVTPVVRGVDSKSLTAVSSAISELVGKAKEKRLKQDELEGGSFSVSNLGMYGTVEFSAILNPPQSGILAVGAAKPQAVVVDGEVRVATVMRCTLSVDHRAVDGALAARWLAAFTERIENPLSILL
jgi:pyruvate dehydrogenase E2 component (dihydrolipoamide acetyltransferase)